jgi:hypothetical protein
MENLNLTDCIARIAVFNHEIAQIIAALTVHAAAEPSHSRRGPILTLRQLLTDLHHGLHQAQAQYQAT